ncbi:MAG TPA: T9SS type A sorting domain-containing protein, partial [Candidatus Kapabacteria bacterium]|nr:T9SS type A sorting domain-containing protein [Candidatus Kapabacteria bacterium]
APNPARGQVTLRVDLASAGDASFEIVDQLGERVMSGALGHLDAGRSYRSLDVAGLASGAYVVVLRTDAGLVSVPLVIAR